MLEPWQCILANTTFPFVSTEVFITEAQTDKVVLLAHDWVPDERPHWSPPVRTYMGAWAHNMTLALAAAMAPSSRAGVFSPACFIHTGFEADAPRIGGRAYLRAFTDWYFDRVPVKLRDECGILCNPNCTR